MTWKNDQVSQVETEKIIGIAREQLVCEGDFVEMGCYKGDTALLIAEMLPSDRKLWIYDSFEGLPEKDAKDESVLGADFKGGELAVTKREVKERFLRAGIKVPVIKKAWFKDLTLADMPEKIAFAFLDGDFYESIRDSLRLVENLVVPCGKVVVHDYNNAALPGVKKAVDEWLEGKSLRTEILQSMIIICYNE